MNDFTKDELQYLFRTFMLTNGDDFEHKLEAKLQSMIDNYCDHIWTDGGGKLISCGLCHVIVGKR